MSRLSPRTALIRYRPFRNCDPPGIAEVWRSQPPLRGRAQPMSPLLLETHVFSKPYFDPQGLIVALEGERVIGFAHGGFGADDEGASLCRELGTVCVVQVVPHEHREEVGRELIARAEGYLRGQGAKVIYGGGVWPLNPFYLGLYGGSEMPGILASDTWAAELFPSCGYREIQRCIVFQRELAGFRPPVDRRQIQIRRRYTIEATFDPVPQNWWETCTYGQTDRTQFDLRSRDAGPPAATATFWDMEPLATSWGIHAVGLVHFETDAGQRRQGLATYLVSEALRQLHAHGIVRCEAQTMQENAAAVALYQKLGFVEIDRGIVFRKESG